MYQVIMLAIIIILLIGYLYYLFYCCKKRMEYKNDERWQKIENMASKISTWYFQFIILLLAIGSTLLLFTSDTIMISLDRVLSYGFDIIIFSNIVELFALKYFDKKL